jgi:hypothetical protein
MCAMGQSHRRVLTITDVKRVASAVEEGVIHSSIHASSAQTTAQRRLLSLILMSTAFAVGGCGLDAPAAPSSASVVTFAVQNETFRVSVPSADQLAAARAAQNGGRAKIPIGRIVLGTEANTGWGWHLEELSFTETTIELCDGRPSDVERQGTAFGGGRYCPWTAVIVRIDER